MRVIQVIAGVAARMGGPTYGTLHLANALQRHGVEAPVYSTNQSGPAQLGRRSTAMPLEMPAISAECEILLFPIRRPARLAYAPELLSALERGAESADLIHIHGLFLYPTYAAYQVARRTKTPYIVSPHGSLDPYIRRTGRVRKAAAHAAWQARLFRGAAALHATTPEEADLWPEYARRRPIAIVPNGITLADYADLPQGLPFRHRIGVGPTDPLIVNIGRLTEKKNLETLVRATAEIHRETGIKAHLALVGPDDENLTHKLTAIASECGIASYLHLTGPLDGQEKLEALAAGNVFALPSKSENFGIAVLEAVAAGVPTLISPHVNLAPQLRAANAALIAPPTKHDTADGLARILTEPGLSQHLSQSGRTFAGAFDWTTTSATMIANYMNIAGSERASALEGPLAPSEAR